MTRSARLRRIAALSLVELMVVIAILGVILAAAIPAMNDFIERRRIEGVTTELLSDLAMMRAETLGKPSSALQALLAVGAGGEKTCYSIYWNTAGGDVSCDCRLPAGSACTSSDRPWAEIKTVKVPAHYGLQVTSSRAFGSMSRGNAFSPVGFWILVEGRGEAKLRVEIDGRANVKVCSPSGKLRGYQACA